VNIPESPPFLLSGNRPTGALHLGHGAGTLRECRDRQKESRCYLLVANLPSLTSSPLWAKDMERRVLDVDLH
jgi:tryptophanyl-tRNA synthetase